MLCYEVLAFNFPVLKEKKKEKQQKETRTFYHTLKLGESILSVHPRAHIGPYNHFRAQLHEKQ